jgi:hypothetical protein
MGHRGPSRGVNGARRGLRHEGAVQESETGEGNKREGETCWKSGGGRVSLYTWRRTGLADEVRSDAIPDAAGGEGGHGAAKPDGVIHRIPDLPFLILDLIIGHNLCQFEIRCSRTHYLG